MSGRARLTIELSRNAMPEARIIAVTSHRPCALLSFMSRPPRVGRTGARHCSRARRASTPRRGRDAECLDLVGVIVGNVGEVGAEQHAVLQAGQSLHDRGVRWFVPEVDERHRGVEHHMGVTVGEVHEFRDLRHPHVRDHQAQLRMTGQDAGDAVRSREASGCRPGTGMDHDRRARLGERAPHRLEQRVVRVEITDLQVGLEHPHAGVHELGHVRRRFRLGEERRRPQRVRRAVGEAAGPVVEEARHARLVRVRERREPPHSHRAQVLDPLVIGAAVVDRPQSGRQCAVAVEVRPHLRHDPRVHEVHVDVEEAGDAELGRVRRQVLVLHSHPLDTRAGTPEP